MPNYTLNLDFTYQNNCDNTVVNRLRVTVSLHQRAVGGNWIGQTRNVPANGRGTFTINWVGVPGGAPTRWKVRTVTLLNGKSPCSHDCLIGTDCSDTRTKPRWYVIPAGQTRTNGNYDIRCICRTGAKRQVKRKPQSVFRKKPVKKTIKKTKTKNKSITRTAPKRKIVKRRR